MQSWSWIELDYSKTLRGTCLRVDQSDDGRYARSRWQDDPISGIPKEFLTSDRQGP